MTDLVWHTEKRKIKELVSYEKNPRILTDKKKEQLKKSLEKFNLAEIPAINADNTLIARHQRIKVLIELGRSDEEIDVRVPNRMLTEEEFKEYNITSNIQIGMWDKDLLEEAFADVDLGDLGLDIDNIELPQPEDAKHLEAEEDDFEVPEEVKTNIVLGDLIEIGPHRLLCGDSTDSDQVAKLMDGKKADLIHTDPPYNVDYGANKNHPSWNVRSIKNDKLDASSWEQFCKALYSNFRLFSRGGDIYMWGASGPEGMKMRLWLVEAGAHWSATIIWKKDQLVLSPAKYQRLYEPCFYGWFDKSTFVADRKQVEVWDVDRPKRSKEHPTMKPITLCEIPIKNSSKPGDIVLDFFLGSGSTMVASHQLDRVCYGLELDPKYCQVIINRMLKLDETLVVKVNGKKYKPYGTIAL